LLGGSPASSPIANLIALPGRLGAFSPEAAILGVVTIAVLILWKKLPWAGLRAIPAPLVAVVTGTVVSLVAKMDVKRVDLPDTLAFTQLKLPTEWGVFILAVLTLAIIASVESLLCAVATDKLHSGERSNLDKELTAQGAGNLVSGLLGGLPITGVIVRSSANINAGGVSRWSAVFHGVWILLCVLFLGSLIESIPLAVLAGLLVHVGINLVNLHHIHELTVHNEVRIYWATVIGVTCVNLLAGVGIGVAVSVFFAIRRLSLVKVEKRKEGEIWKVAIRGTLTFACVPKLNYELSSLPAGSVVDIDLDVDFIDHAAFECLHSWRLNHEKTGGKVCVEESQEEWYKPAVEGRPRGSRGA
jgi:carbonic anhydrase